MLHIFFCSLVIIFYCGTGWSVELPLDTNNTLHELTKGHSLEEETAKIRKHHLKRLNDRLTIEPKILQQTCRYESDIQTRPPKKRVAFTFDDGPEPGQTEHILEV